MNIKMCEVQDIQSYSSIVFDLLGTSEEPIWYRGQSNFEHSLIPSLLRRPNITSTSIIQEEEDYFMQKFDQRGRPYTVERNLGEFEKLFIMQHYGFPTRLLDWSENPYAGLYFALDDDEKDGAVYMLKPRIWNEHSLGSRESGIKRILNTNEDFVDTVSPSKIKNGHPHALTIYATHNTTRIIAQRGVFTIFGASLDSMDKQYGKFSDDQEDENILSKIKIPKECKVDLRKQLHRTGVTESVMFPDLEHLATECKRERGY